MAVSVSFNGKTFIIPDNFDTQWGLQVSAFLKEVAAGAMVKGSTAVTPAGDIDYGPTAGLLAKYFKGKTSNGADTGILRLAAIDSVAWRNQANTGNVLLSKDSNDQLTFGGKRIPTAESANDTLIGWKGSNPAETITVGVNVSDRLVRTKGADIQQIITETNPNNVGIAWFNQAGTAVLKLVVDTTNQLKFDSQIVLTETNTAVVTGKSLSGLTNTFSNIPQGALQTLSWSKVSKTGANINSLPLRSHTDLQNIGVKTHAQLDIDTDAANNHIGQSLGVHGLSGDVVGTTDQQQLENKTLLGGTLLRENPADWDTVPPTPPQDYLWIGTRRDKNNVQRLVIVDDNSGQIWVGASGGGGSPYWADPVVDKAELDITAGQDGEVRQTLDNNEIWVYDSVGAVWLPFVGAKQFAAPVDLVTDLPVTAADGEVRLVKSPIPQLYTYVLGAWSIYSLTSAEVSDFTSAAAAVADGQILLQKGVADGLATLDAAGYIPSSQIPALAITDTYVVATVADLVTLSAAEIGDVGVVTDPADKGSWILQSNPYSVLTNWVRLETPTDLVLSVNGQTGIVDLTTDDITEGLSNLYYSDARASSAAPVQSVAGQTGAVVLSKTDVGLDQVDNTSDVNKPVSTDQEAADLIVREFARARANHTGTQDVSTITNFWSESFAAVAPYFVRPNTLYVHPFVGDDTTGDGSIAKPYATIAKAHTEATDGFAIILYAAVYPEPAPIITKGVAIVGASKDAVILTNGINIIASPTMGGFFLKGINANNVGINLAATPNCLGTISECSLSYTRQDAISDCFVSVSNSTIFGVNIVGGSNEFSKCLSVGTFQAYGGNVFIDNCKLVQQAELEGGVIAQFLDTTALSGTLANGTINATIVPTIRIDHSSSALGTLTGDYTLSVLNSPYKIATGSYGTLTADVMNIGTIDKFKLTSEDVAVSGAGIVVSPNDKPIKRITSGGPIRGVMGSPFTGLEFTLVNVSGSEITINNDDTGAAAAFRVLTGTGSAFALKDKAACKLVYDSSIARWLLTGGGGSAAGGSTINITQTAHGFLVGQALYFNGSIYILANASAANTAEVVGLVSKVIDANSFTLTLAGQVTGLSGLVSGEVYFLSTVDGTLSTSEPTIIGQVSLPVGIADSTTSLIVNIGRGIVLGGSNARTQLTLANNATTTVLNAGAYDAGEITGWVYIQTTASKKFYVSAQFAKNGAGTDYNLTYQTVGDVPPIGFNVGITAAGLVQVTLPLISPFTSASINYGLNAPAVGATFPLSISARNVLGDTSGTAAPTGVLGELKTASKSSASSQNISATTWTNLKLDDGITDATIPVGSGSWRLTLVINLGGSVSAGDNVKLIAISEFSGTTTTDHLQGKSYSFATSPTVAQDGLGFISYTVNNNTAKTYFIKIYLGVASATTVVRFHAEAVRVG